MEDRELDDDELGLGTAVVIPARAGERLDADGPFQMLGKYASLGATSALFNRTFQAWQRGRRRGVGDSEFGVAADVDYERSHY